VDRQSACGGASNGVCPQQTIRGDVELDGLGLFSGEPARMRLRPGEPNSGIQFIRTDQSPPIRIAARVDNVLNRPRRTTLKNGTVAIDTVEHCLSACAGLSIDNIQIELEGNEVPGMDGSCLPLVERLRAVGICPQDAPRHVQTIDGITRVVDGDAELVALPPLGGDTHLEITYDLDYGAKPPIGRQVYRVIVTPDTFEANIAPARTFVMSEEAEQLRAAGLGKHLTPADVLVFGEDGPIGNELRFPDECVRHKILDLIGDLSLLGCPIAGRIFARKSGHSLNHELVRKLAEKRHASQRTAPARPLPHHDIHGIQRILPHRYPFLMVDRILEIQGTQRVVGVKNVTINEPYFQGHYPSDPIMPGVLVIEALAQIGGVLLSQEFEHTGKIAVLLSLDKVKFRKAVRPGDQLMLEATTLRVRPTMGHVQGRALVDGELVAEADIKFVLTDAEAGI